MRCSSQDQNFVDQIDSCIKAGQFSQARTLLRSIRAEKIPESLLLKTAELARRAQLFRLALKILWPKIRQNSPGTSSDAERAEYAGSLLRAGSVSEARELLSECQEDQAAEVHLFRGYCEVVEWEYEKAAVHFTRYLDFSAPTAYQRAVAKLNLAASLSYCNKWTAAAHYLTELKEFSLSKGHKLLLANTLEQQTQIAIQTGDFDNAHHLLTEAELATPGHNNVHHLWLRKWRVVLACETEIAKSGQIPSSVWDLQKILEEAISLRDYETQRDLSFQIAKFSRDEFYLKKIFFGTPFASFRQRVCALGWAPPPVCRLPLAPNLESSALKDCLTLSSLPGLKEGTSTWRMIVALLQDFFKPQTIGSLFRQLYPGQFFDPFSSGDRVHQVLLRTRRWIKESHLNWEIKFDRGRALLQIGGPRELEVPADLGVWLLSPIDLQLRKIQQKFGSSEFRTTDVSRVFELSPAKAQRILKQGVDSKKVMQLGKGIYTVFKFTG